MKNSDVERVSPFFRGVAISTAVSLGLWVALIFFFRWAAKLSFETWIYIIAAGLLLVGSYIVGEALGRMERDDR